jgi:hypothetical protein
VIFPVVLPAGMIVVPPVALVKSAGLVAPLGPAPSAVD